MSSYHVDDRAFRYGLAYRRGRICIDMPEDVYQLLRKPGVFDTAHGLRGFVEGLFVPPREDGSWGFDGAAVTLRVNKRIRTIALQPPRPVDKDTYNHSAAFALTLTIRAITTALSFSADFISWPKSAGGPAQHASIYFVGASPTTSGSGLLAYLSWPFAEWVVKHGYESTVHPRVLSAMWNSYSRMTGERGRDGYRFHIEKQEKRFYLQVPGDACDIGIYADRSYMDGEDRELASHNVDSPIQLVALLAGFSVLCESAQQALDKA